MTSMPTSRMKSTIFAVTELQNAMRFPKNV